MKPSNQPAAMHLCAIHEDVVHKILFIDSALCGTPERTVNVQIVRVVIAGGLLRSTEGLLQATTHKQPRQQAAALAPIRFPLNLLCLERHQCDLCLSCILLQSRITWAHASTCMFCAGIAVKAARYHHCVEAELLAIVPTRLHRM